MVQGSGCPVKSFGSRQARTYINSCTHQWCDGGTILWAQFKAYNSDSPLPCHN